MPTIAAMAYKTAKGHPIVYPKNDYSYAENFLYMLFATPCEEIPPTPRHGEHSPWPGRVHTSICCKVNPHPD